MKKYSEILQGRERKPANAGSEGCQILRSAQNKKANEDKQHKVGRQSETGRHNFKKGEGWSLKIYIVLLIEIDTRGLILIT